jgi:hypothetical protein
MIKVVKATYVRDRVLELTFSDGSTGQYDFAPQFERKTALTKAWDDIAYFRSYFIELGAIGWPNGLEFGPQSLHRTLSEAGLLHHPQRVA